MYIMRTLLAGLLLTALPRCGAELAAEQAQRRQQPNIQIPLTLQQTQLILAGSAATAIAKAAATSRGPPPPLRSVVGAREEASLVEDEPPGPLGLLLRGLTLFCIFLPVLLLAPIAFLVPACRSAFWYAMVKRCLASAGTAFIKWGQWAACRPDMFPEGLCAQLAELHSQAPVHNCTTPALSSLAAHP